jgi:hypothetical protein
MQAFKRMLGLSIPDTAETNAFKFAEEVNKNAMKRYGGTRCHVSNVLTHLRSLRSRRRPRARGAAQALGAAGPGG